MHRALTWLAIVIVALPAFGQTTPLRSPAWTSSGPPNPGVDAIATSEDDDSLVYAGAGSYGLNPEALFVSRDAGLSWIELAQAPAGETVSAVAIDPLSPSNLIAATRSLVGTTLLYRSPDGGSTWSQALVAGVGCGNSIAFERIDDRALLACGDHLFRTSDAGITWERIQGPAKDVTGVVASGDGSVFAYGADAIYRTDDAGASWSFVSAAPVPCPITALAVSAGVPMTLLVGAAGPAPRGSEVCGGVSRSVDGGASWTTGLELYISDIRIDQRDPSRVFASAIKGPGFFGLPGGVFMSEDGGQSWKSLDMPYLFGAVAIAVSSSGRTLYAATDSVLQYRFRRPLEVGPRESR